MAGMSRNNTIAIQGMQGFSIFQPALGSTLQFIPALGTAELDILIDAFLPGPAPLKEKRATVCMDFCEYSRQTGETIKFYPVYSVPAADSPASSMYDSGYGSNFNASPDTTWSPATFASPATPAAAAAVPSRSSKARSASERKSSTASARAPARDFSHLPGMKIMTKDGQDVTNSASRGCKTKEQRDHAHLMRIIKACDACRRKKIRCDPSHRKRTASQAQSPSESKPTKKARKAVVESPLADPTVASASLPLEETVSTELFDLLDAESDSTWEQFVQYEEDPVAQAPYSYDFFADPHGYFTPSSISSASPPQQLFTPPAAASSAADSYSGSLFADVLDNQQATLPYLTDGSHGTNYLDFNLYSPASSSLDGELQQFQTEARAGSKRQSTSQLNLGDPGSWNGDLPAGGLDSRRVTSPQDESYLCGCTDDRQQGLQSVHVPDPGWDVPGVPRPGDAQGLRIGATGSRVWITPKTTMSTYGRQLQTPATPASPHHSLDRGLIPAWTKELVMSPLDCSDAVAMSLPPLQETKRCGKDESMSALSTTSPPAALSDVAHSSTPSLTRRLLAAHTALSTTHLVSWTGNEQQYYSSALQTSVDSATRLEATTSSPPEPRSTRAPTSCVPRDDQEQSQSMNLPEQHTVIVRPFTRATSVPEQRRITAVTGVDADVCRFDAPSSASPISSIPALLRVEGANVGASLGALGGGFLHTTAPGVLSPANVLLAAIILSLPVRQFVDGSRKLDSSSLVAALVVFGLVALSAFVMQSPSPILAKLPTFALPLAAAAMRHPTSPSPSQQTLSASVSVPGLAKHTIDNVKSKIQAASAKLHRLRCVLSRRVSGGRRRATLKRAFSP